VADMSENEEALEVEVYQVIEAPEAAEAFKDVEVSVVKEAKDLAEGTLKVTFEYKSAVVESVAAAVTAAAAQLLRNTIAVTAVEEYKAAVTAVEEYKPVVEYKLADAEKGEPSS
jgi:hypothetical protein